MANREKFRPLDWLVFHVGQWWEKRYQKACKRNCTEIQSQMKSCGKDFVIRRPFHISGLSSLEIGDNVHIGPNCFIQAKGGVKIGDNTHFSRNIVINSRNHQFEGQRLPYDDSMICKPVVIGKNVWVGMNVCIAPGTVIGDGAIIGIGTVVSGEIPPLAIIGNQKWRIIRYRDKEHYEDLDRKGAYGGTNGAKYEADSD